jgi:hypothetical protein
LQLLNNACQFVHSRILAGSQVRLNRAEESF